MTYYRDNGGPIDGEAYGQGVVTFRDNNVSTDDTTYTRQIKMVRRIAGTDIAVVTLVNSSTWEPDALPDDITPMKLLPQGYALDPSDPLPVVFTNYDRALLIGQYDGIQTVAGYPNEIQVVDPTDARFEGFFYPVRVGDSGAPAMVLINGELAVMANWHFLGGYGPNHAGYFTQIQSAIDANATALSIGQHDLAPPVDLSAFTDYSALV